MHGNVLNSIQEFSKDDDIDNYLNKKQQTPYENEGSIEIAMQVKNNYQNDNVDSTVLDYKGQVDNVNNKMQENFKIHYSDNVSFEGSYVRNNDQYALLPNEVTRGYAVVKNENLKDFFGKMGIQSKNIPDKIEFLEQEKNIDDATIEYLKTKYGEIIKNNLSEENFSKIKENGKTGYTLTTTIDKLNKIAFEILNVAKADEKVRSLVESPDSVSGSYETAISTLIEKLDTQEENEEVITITVYEPRNGVTSCTITSEESELKIDVSNVKIEIEVYKKNVYSEEKTNAGKISIEKEVSNNSKKYNFNAQMKNITMQTNQEILFNMVCEVSGLNTDIIEEKITMVMNSNDTDESIAMGIEYKNINRFKDSVEIVELNNTNSVILNDLAKDDLINAIEQMLGRTQEVNEIKIKQSEEDSGSGISKIIELIQNQSMTLFNNSYNEENVNANENLTNNDMQQQNVEAANAQYKMYEGEKSYTEVKALLTTIKVHNESDADNKIAVNGNTNSEEIENIKNSLENEKIYKISFEYNEMGYINNTIIK